jgi:tRNA threonylcarbamoyladenosine biosynthesis protein TsaE|tara:strand:+ start:199 stop:549 length:351 start_codon:yes stop_codon:yes gene_type:complete
MKLLLEITIKSKTKMHNFGIQLSKLFSQNDLITFDGDLGVGKTFLCKSIINNLTKINEVVSPTFNIVQTYPLQEDEEIWHCDFYRINSFEEVDEIGVFEDLKKKLFFLNGQNFIMN